MPTSRTPEQLRDRLLQRRRITPAGCWLWTGYVTPKGYGQIRVGRRLVYVHRLAYEMFVGEVPEGRQVDHECHNADGACPGGTCEHRACFNPEHLRSASPRANSLAGRVGDLRHRPECRHGHPWPEWRRIATNGRVYCGWCARLARARWAARRRRERAA